ncbi:MAG: AzlC family ABC transporter permease, partial [Bosea sp. (in: a-proteobacteria)]
REGMDGHNQTPQTDTASSAPVITLAGVVRGVMLFMPLLPGVIIFAMAFGAAAAAKGLTLFEATAMSAFVYAGLSQMIALENWKPEWTAAGLLGLAFVTGAVNGRMALQGASLQSWLVQWPRRVNYPQLFFLTDANWLIAERERAADRNDLGVMIGAGVGLWVVWVIATIPGHLAGSLMDDPRRFGLDLLLPVYFAAMLVPVWKGPRLIAPWAVAAIVSIAAAQLIGGYSYVILGALAGALTGALMPDKNEGDSA